MILNKFARRLLSTVITSASFSLGFGNVNAITEEQKEAIFSWAKMMWFDEKNVLERLTFRIRGGREFCLVPVYKFEDLKVFLRTLFNNLYSYSNLTKDVRVFLCNMARSDISLYNHALRSLSFLVACGDAIVGKLCIVDMDAYIGNRPSHPFLRMISMDVDYRDPEITKAIRSMCINNAQYIRLACNRNKEILRI